MSKASKAFKNHWRHSHKESYCHYCKVLLDCSFKPSILYYGITQKDNDFTLDHFIPLSEGGKDKRENYIVCCFECNHKRGEVCAWRGSIKDKIELIEEYISLKPQIAECPDFFKYVFKKHFPKVRKFERFYTNYG